MREFTFEKLLLQIASKRGAIVAAAPLDSNIELARVYQVLRSDIQCPFGVGELSLKTRDRAIARRGQMNQALLMVRPPPPRSALPLAS